MQLIYSSQANFFSRNQSILDYCSVGCFNQFLCSWRSGMYSSTNFTVRRKALATYPNQLLWAPAPAASHFNLLTIQFGVQKHAQEKKKSLTLWYMPIKLQDAANITYLLQQTHMKCDNHLNVTCRKGIFLNSSPEQSQQQICFLCLLCLSQQIEHEQHDFSNFKFSTIEDYTVCFCSFCVSVSVWERETLIVCICLRVSMFVCVWDVPHVSLVLKCRAHSAWLHNEFSRLRTGEPTLLITQINKHADEQQRWNNGNTIGSVSSVADREDNYSYPPTPPFKHPLLLSSHLPSCLFIILLSHAVIFFFFLASVISFFCCIFVFASLSLTVPLLLFLRCN